MNNDVSKAEHPPRPPRIFSALLLVIGVVLPLGSANELGPLGLKARLAIPMGVPYTGGTVVTKGGLVFMGGTMDRRLRALELSTGKVLWSDVLPNNAQATPMSYISPQTGKQYVVIAVPAIPKADAGGWLIAYALPEVDTR